MKTIVLFVKGLNRDITFCVGQNKKDNFELLDVGKPDDLWFHASSHSSCHVLAIIPEDIGKKDLMYIIKIGASLCKSNTNKLRSLCDVEIIYSSIKNVHKTAIPGCVNVFNKKSIIV